MPSDVRLNIDGVSYGGWTAAEVKLSMANIAGSFSLQLTERWADQATPRPIRPGQRCELYLNEQLVITGHVDDIEPSYDSETHRVSVRGRDKTADLVDCAVQYRTGQWKDRTLVQLARDVTSPYGIEVIAEVDTGAPFRTRKIQEGESVFEFLERAARTRGVLLTTSGRGELLITRVPSARSRDNLVLGKNIVSAKARFSHRDRHSEYIVKGTRKGGDFGFGDDVIERLGTARDDRIARFRPLVINAEDQVDNAEAATRAIWERNVRFGRSLEVPYTVQGWSQSDGALWRHNRLTYVRDPFMGLDQELLISAVRYVLDDSGERCELTVTRPEAFDVIPIPEPPTESSFGFASL